MEITNKRIAHSKNSSLGLLDFNGVPQYFIIEDEFRTIKVKGETRIPAGRYKLAICKIDTPLTLKHREQPAYKDWFKYHIEVTGVPNFTGIFIHIGNTEHDTEGCQLPNLQVKILNGEFVGSFSTDATKHFYSVVYPLLESGQEVYYNVKDIDL
jgi:hypothetical protein